MTLDFIKFNSLKNFTFNKMDTLFSVKQNSLSPDGLGGLEETWHEVLVAWGKIIPSPKNYTASIIMRYDPAILNNMRIVSESSTYIINNVTNIKNHFLLISTKEVKDEF